MGFGKGDQDVVGLGVDTVLGKKKSTTDTGVCGFGSSSSSDQRIALEV